MSVVRLDSEPGHQGQGRCRTRLHDGVRQSFGRHNNLERNGALNTAVFRPFLGVEHITGTATRQDFDVAHPADVLIVDCDPLHGTAHFLPRQLPSPRGEVCGNGNIESNHFALPANYRRLSEARAS